MLPIGIASGKRPMELLRSAGTTSIQSADEEGFVVSVTPSDGWIPSCLAGRTGIGMSQRMQSSVLDESIDPFNVLEPEVASHFMASVCNPR